MLPVDQHSTNETNGIEHMEEVLSRYRLDYLVQ